MIYVLYSTCNYFLHKRNQTHQYPSGARNRRGRSGLARESSSPCRASCGTRRTPFAAEGTASGTRSCTCGGNPDTAPGENYFANCQFHVVPYVEAGQNSSNPMIRWNSSSLRLRYKCVCQCFFAL